MDAAGVSEVRVVLTVPDLASALAFWRDGLGLAVEADWDEPVGHGTVLAAGRATIELLDETHARYVEQIEARDGEPAPVRFALAVPDADSAANELAAKGGNRLPLVVTPWGDRNVRVVSPEGIQLTLFSAGQRD